LGDQPWTCRVWAWPALGGLTRLAVRAGTVRELATPHANSAKSGDGHRHRGHHACCRIRPPPDGDIEGRNSDLRDTRDDPRSDVVGALRLPRPSLSLAEVEAALIHRLYDAAIDQRLWSAFLRECAVVLNSRAMVLLARFVPPVRVPAIERFHGICPAFAQSYATHFYESDTVLQRASRLPPGSIFQFDDFFTSRVEFERTPLFRDWLQPQGLSMGKGLVILPGAPYSSMLVTLTNQVECPLAPHADALLACLAPHLRRGVTVLSELERARSHWSLVNEVLDRIPAGVLCVGRSGRVHLTNATAARILARRDGASLQQRRLRVGEGAERRSFERILDRATADEDPQEACLSVFRPSGADRLTLLLTPLETTDKLGTDEHGMAVAFIDAPQALSPLDARDLAALFGLTAGQARMAVLLARGLRLENVASELDLSLNTVRTRIKDIFKRTRTSRQAELVRRLVLSAARFRSTRAAD